MNISPFNVAVLSHNLSKKDPNVNRKKVALYSHSSLKDYDCSTFSVDNLFVGKYTLGHACAC